jgi:hypothetical protein
VALAILGRTRDPHFTVTCHDPEEVEVWQLERILHSRATHLLQGYDTLESNLEMRLEFQKSFVEMCCRLFTQLTLYHDSSR